MTLTYSTSTAPIQIDADEPEPDGIALTPILRLIPLRMPYERSIFCLHCYLYPQWLQEQRRHSLQSLSVR